MISGRYFQVTKLWLSGGHSVLGPSVAEPNGLQTISNHHLGYTLIIGPDVGLLFFTFSFLRLFVRYWYGRHLSLSEEQHGVPTYERGAISETLKTPNSR